MEGAWQALTSFLGLHIQSPPNFSNLFGNGQKPFYIFLKIQVSSYLMDSKNSPTTIQVQKCGQMLGLLVARVAAPH